MQQELILELEAHSGTLMQKPGQLVDRALPLEMEKPTH
ncbi:hypothetical protein ACCUM_3822 [Candidatus Accumulibacter phosphatis]|uniref:Uncharacterized protein n=1 Tax=Candidatus Accumulibacter phosphatis TaxID=327160 RepID=A0A5S4EH63_9PROT|nr:hypothetical protein ACCUM_3822 [Candidatus Accumulibacter phosphatis]